MASPPTLILETPSSTSASPASGWASSASSSSSSARRRSSSSGAPETPPLCEGTGATGTIGPVSARSAPLTLSIKKQLYLATPCGAPALSQPATPPQKCNLSSPKLPVTHTSIQNQRYPALLVSSTCVPAPLYSAALVLVHCEDGSRHPVPVDERTGIDGEPCRCFSFRCARSSPNGPGARSRRSQLARHAHARRVQLASLPLAYTLRTQRKGRRSFSSICPAHPPRHLRFVFRETGFVPDVAPNPLQLARTLGLSTVEARLACGVQHGLFQHQRPTCVIAAPSTLTDQDRSHLSSPVRDTLHSAPFAEHSLRASLSHSKRTARSGTASISSTFQCRASQGSSQTRS